MDTTVFSVNQITIPSTTTGPPGTGHGGACAGLFATAIDLANATVRFHTPIPLATPLRIERTDGPAKISDGESTIATVRPLAAPLSVTQFGRLANAEVVAAEARFLDHHNGEHMAPTCFACGDQRNDSLGLNLRPGQVGDTGLIATGWEPQLDADVPAWMIWAALDCPSGIPALAKVGLDEAVVTGELSVEIQHAVPGGGKYQILGRRTGRDGRKFTTEAAIIDESGCALAIATATWIVVPIARLRAQEELAAAV